MTKKEKFDADVARLDEVGATYITYPAQYIINAEDVRGIIQSFCSTTGTIIIRKDNDKYSKFKKTYHNEDVETFILLLNKQTF